jgi:hypothetical protein
MGIHLTPADLTKPEYLIERGWVLWEPCDFDFQKFLVLCPLEEYRYVPENTVFYSINGQRKIKGQSIIDMDDRGGILAVGIMFDMKLRQPFRSLDDEWES